MLTPIETFKQQVTTQFGAHLLVTNLRERVAFECDALTIIKQVPPVVVLVENAEQICQIVAWCQELHLPIVPRGAGTGLSGGATPHAQGVLLVLTRMCDFEEIEVDNRTLRVQPCATNLSLSAAVAQLGLFFAPDPSSQLASTIGGNVAENSGGVHCLKYGLTVHNVVGVNIVNADGKLLQIGSNTLQTAGFDLLSIIHGSEGLLGIITEVTVRLLPKPQAVEVMMIAFSAMTDAANAVADIIASGVIPAGLEMMDGVVSKEVEAWLHIGYPTDADAVLLCELDGSNEEIAINKNIVVRLMEKHHAMSLRCAATKEEQMLFWQGRKSAFPLAGGLAADYLCIDGSIKRRFLAQVLLKINALTAAYGLRVLNVFHAGDGNLHPLILFDASVGDEKQRAQGLANAIMSQCIQAGGTISGEHGVGLEKLDGMCEQFTTNELRIFEKIKSAFDPSRIFNPEKAIPTLARCAELGGMHVHNGNIPFPHLERL